MSEFAPFLYIIDTSPLTVHQNCRRTGWSCGSKLVNCPRTTTVTTPAEASLLRTAIDFSLFESYIRSWICFVQSVFLREMEGETADLIVGINEPEFAVFIKGG